MMDSTLLATHADTTQAFVHDTLKDFFLACYVATQLNRRAIDVDDVPSHLEPIPITPLEKILFNLIFDNEHAQSNLHENTLPIVIELADEPEKLVRMLMQRKQRPSYVWQCYKKSLRDVQLELEIAEYCCDYVPEGKHGPFALNNALDVLFAMQATDKLVRYLTSPKKWERVFTFTKLVQYDYEREKPLLDLLEENTTNNTAVTNVKIVRQFYRVTKHYGLQFAWCWLHDPNLYDAKGLNLWKDDHPLEPLLLFNEGPLDPNYTRFV